MIVLLAVIREIKFFNVYLSIYMCNVYLYISVYLSIYLSIYVLDVHRGRGVVQRAAAEGVQ